MNTQKQQLKRVLSIVISACIDISDYDDESRTLNYHAKQLEEAESILKEILKEAP